MLNIELMSNVLVLLSSAAIAVCAYRAKLEQDNRRPTILDAVAKYHLHPYCELYHRNIDEVRRGIQSLSQRSFAHDSPIEFSREGLAVLLDKLEGGYCTTVEYAAIMYLKGLKDSLDYKSPKQSPIVLPYQKMLTIVNSAIGEFSLEKPGVI